jgi:hypothetical protein
MEDNVTLKNLVERYETDRDFLAKHPEHMAMLEGRIRKHEKAIVAYVTSEKFKPMLNNLQL